MHGQQARVSGPGTDKSDSAGDLAGAGHDELPIILSAPEAIRSAASRLPTPAGSVTTPVSVRRTASLPSAAVTTAVKVSSAGLARISASAPIGAEQPASSFASRARSAGIHPPPPASAK